MNAATFWQALQGVGIAGILVVVIWALNRGSLVSRAAHQEIITAQMAVITELSREIARLEAEINRLQAVLAARGSDD